MSFDRTRWARKEGRYEPDLSELPALVADAVVGHAAFEREGQPVVVPTAVAFEPPDALLMHGSTGSGWMRWLATGAPVAVSITALDALVVARSAFESSMRYRSAVLFGTCELVEEERVKRAALDRLTDTLIPGRVAEVRPSTAKELAATMVCGCGSMTRRSRPTPTRGPRTPRTTSRATPGRASCRAGRRTASRRPRPTCAPASRSRRRSAVSDQTSGRPRSTPARSTAFSTRPRSRSSAGPGGITASR